ncbi:MAG: FHA domain-containing protein [Candidatus Micrarchaeia archaeon]
MGETVGRTTNYEQQEAPSRVNETLRSLRTTDANIISFYREKLAGQAQLFLYNTNYGNVEIAENKARIEAVESILSASKITDTRLVPILREMLWDVFSKEISPDSPKSNRDSYVPEINYVRDEIIERMMRSPNMLGFLIQLLDETGNGEKKYERAEYYSLVLINSALGMPANKEIFFEYEPTELLLRLDEERCNYCGGFKEGLLPPAREEAFNIAINGEDAGVDKLAYWLCTGKYESGEFTLPNEFNVPEGFGKFRDMIMASPDIPTYREWVDTSLEISRDEKTKSTIIDYIEILIAAKRDNNLNFNDVYNILTQYQRKVDNTVTTKCKVYQDILEEYQNAGLVFRADERAAILFAVSVLGEGNGVCVAGEIAAKAHYNSKAANDITAKLLTSMGVKTVPEIGYYAATPFSLGETESRRTVKIMGLDVVLDGNEIASLKENRIVKKTVAAGWDSTSKCAVGVIFANINGKIHCMLESTDPASILNYFEANYGDYIEKGESIKQNARKYNVNAFAGILRGEMPPAGAWDITAPLKEKYANMHAESQTLRTSNNIIRELENVQGDLDAAHRRIMESVSDSANYDPVNVTTFILKDFFAPLRLQESQVKNLTRLLESANNTKLNLDNEYIAIRGELYANGGGLKTSGVDMDALNRHMNKYNGLVADYMQTLTELRECLEKYEINSSIESLIAGVNFALDIGFVLGIASGGTAAYCGIKSAISEYGVKGTIKLLGQSAKHLFTLDESAAVLSRLFSWEVQRGALGLTAGFGAMNVFQQAADIGGINQLRIGNRQELEALIGDLVLLNQSTGNTEYRTSLTRLQEIALMPPEQINWRETEKLMKWTYTIMLGTTLIGLAGKELANAPAPTHAPAPVANGLRIDEMTGVVKVGNRWVYEGKGKVFGATKEPAYVYLNSGPAPPPNSIVLKPGSILNEGGRTWCLSPQNEWYAITPIGKIKTGPPIVKSLKVEVYQDDFGNLVVLNRTKKALQVKNFGGATVEIPPKASANIGTFAEVSYKGQTYSYGTPRTTAVSQSQVSHPSNQTNNLPAKPADVDLSQNRTIGRDTDNFLATETSISRNHATIKKNPDNTHTLVDNSTYGTVVWRAENRYLGKWELKPPFKLQKGQQLALQEGDILVLGGSNKGYVYSGGSLRGVDFSDIANLQAKEIAVAIVPASYKPIINENGRLVQIGHVNPNSPFGQKVHIELPSTNSIEHMEYAKETFARLCEIKNQVGEDMAFKFMTGGGVGEAWRMSGAQFGKDFTVYFTSNEAYSKALPDLIALSDDLARIKPQRDVIAAAKEQGFAPNDFNMVHELPVGNNGNATYSIRVHSGAPEGYDNCLVLNLQDANAILQRYPGLDLSNFQAGNRYVFSDGALRYQASAELNRFLREAYQNNRLGWEAIPKSEIRNQ